jgi:hypothetical protein
VPLTNQAAQQVYDTPLADLPPVTRAVREAFGIAAHPVPSAEGVAALLAAVHALELRVIALEA